MTNSAALDLRTKSRKPVYLVAGGKGGVGKSMAALVLTDQLILLGEKVLYFETDTTNADVWFCLERDAVNAPGEAIDGVVMQAIQIDKGDAWAAMMTLIAEHSDRTVVIGTASNTSDAIRQNAHLLLDGLEYLDRKLVTLWVIDEQLDAVNQLKEHLDVFPGSVVHVIKNSKHGPDFPFYEGSDVHASITGKGGLSLLMPRLLLCVVNSLYSGRLAISQALEVIPFGNRVALLHFRKQCKAMLAPILAGEDAP